MKKIYEIYKDLYKEYGPQGWWPFIEFDTIKRDKTGNDVGYHPLDYSYPKTKKQRVEIFLGCILTQNTTFTSVIKAMLNLEKLNAIDFDVIKTMDIEKFKEAIRPAGYFNQKASYILNFIEFYESLEGRVPRRQELLKVKGIGEETADSILLYGYNQVEFKVDAYTKRLYFALGLIDEKAKYKDVKTLIENSLEKQNLDKKEALIVYQEYHALIVEHCKRYYSKKPYALNCFLKEKYSK